MKYTFTTLFIATIAAVATVQATPTGNVITSSSDAKLPFQSDKWVEKGGLWSIKASDVPDFSCDSCWDAGCACAVRGCWCGPAI
ncbi:hypothetical protein HDU97_007972 [Phlyctochytrium planicorne]|nr:hypothetical protein HDU97_007972 [Phlyctochytrium planicorne]